MKKADKTVNISPTFQKLFVLATLSVWLTQDLLILFESMGQDGPAFENIWLYQLSIWGLPILFFLFSLVYLHRKYRGWNLLFWVTFLTVIGEMVYSGLETIVQAIFQMTLSHMPTASNGSFWTGQGSTWFVMIMSTLLFVSGVIFTQKRNV